MHFSPFRRGTSPARPPLSFPSQPSSAVLGQDVEKLGGGNHCPRTQRNWGEFDSRPIEGQFGLKKHPSSTRNRMRCVDRQKQLMQRLNENFLKKENKNGLVWTGP